MVKKILDWLELTRMASGKSFVVERVRIPENDVVIEGSFQLPLMAQLSEEDQIFVAAFVKCHGSIKQMEKTFGVSYPTIKNRLNRIGELFSFLGPDVSSDSPKSETADVLAQLEQGSISVKDALEKLK